MLVDAAQVEASSSGKLPSCQSNCNNAQSSSDAPKYTSMYKDLYGWTRSVQTVRSRNEQEIGQLQTIPGRSMYKTENDDLSQLCHLLLGCLVSFLGCIHEGSQSLALPQLLC